MNRRSYLKSIMAVGTLGAASFSVFKWFDSGKPVTQADLLKKRGILGELVDLIIPETDTPGAKSANVHDYIINVITNCNSARQQHKFYAGIEALEKYAVDTYGKDFVHCRLSQRNAVLTYTAEHSGFSSNFLNKVSNKFLGKPFYNKLRDLTVEGYCLSKTGATEGLAYDYIPGTYEACVPMRPNQKSWATK